jgi:hypothetical protein
MWQVGRSYTDRLALHGGGAHQELRTDLCVGKTLCDELDDFVVGRGQAVPAVGGSVSFAACSLCQIDGVIDRERRSFGERHWFTDLVDHGVVPVSLACR